jgi:AAA family ATP:ADP antiporter
LLYTRRTAMPSARTFFDVRPSERRLVLLCIAYVATVVASFLLAKPIRDALFLKQYGAYKLVYVYAGVPIVLTIVMPAYERLAGWLGPRRVIAVSLAFFAVNVVFFWYAFRFLAFPALSAVFYIWVNCYGVIAPVQAWGLVGGLFDTRQAKRLFGLIGAGASFGAISGGVIASTLVGPVGGAQNLLLVLAGLIAVAGGLVVSISRQQADAPVPMRARERWPLVEAVALIKRDRYLRLIAAVVLLVAIVTQWSGFQFRLVADARFAGNADHLTSFFGRFNVAFGVVALATQLFLTGPLLRRFGIVVTILLLPAVLGAGSALIVLAPAFWPVLLTNAADQTVRFSVDKASYELLYLPLAASTRTRVRPIIDVMLSRMADALGAVLLGVATQGFLAGGGLGLGLRGLAAVNAGFVGIWVAVAWRLRREYVEAIRASIRTHALRTDRTAGPPVLERTAAEAAGEGLQSRDTAEVLYALDLMSANRTPVTHPALYGLLGHPDVEVRRRALALLSQRGDAKDTPHVEPLLRDEDLEIRTEALLFLTRHQRIDPLDRVRELGDVAGFSIRAGMVAFLAHPGPSQNLDAARVILGAMAHERDGGDGTRTRLEAVRLLDRLPQGFDDELVTLVGDPDEAVAREAVRVAGRHRCVPAIPALLERLAHASLQTEVVDALAAMGHDGVAVLRERLLDPGASIAVRREVPPILARIGTPEAEQVLLECLLQPDTSMRHSVIAALNTMRESQPSLGLDPEAIDMLLLAEITGHYRSYQVLGAMGDLDPGDQVIVALKQSMEKEIERIFRLMGLLFPDKDLVSAYVGLRAAEGRICANALEFLEHVLTPQLRGLLLPMIDPQVSETERVELANRLVGIPVASIQEALTTLLDSEDSWLKSCAAYAVGQMQLEELRSELDRWAEHPDPLVRETVLAARRKLVREAEPAAGEDLSAWPSPGVVDMG